MTIGITFEEKILEKITLEKYFAFINANGIKLLELAPNFIAHDIKLYKRVYKQMQINHTQFTFHLPSFIDEKLDVSNFSEKTQKYLIDYFDKLNQIFDFKNNSASIVFHGAIYGKNSKTGAFNKTLLFIQFLLDLFSKKNYSLSLSIETLNKNKRNVIGDSRKDLIQILQQINSPKLKICWDITHDFLNYNRTLYPEGLILKAISHCHVHGFKDGASHLSLSNNTQLFPAIKFAKKNNIPINIELLMQDDYFNILKKDLLTIQSIT